MTNLMNMLNFGGALPIRYRYFAWCVLIMLSVFTNSHGQSSLQAEVNRSVKSSDTENSKMLASDQDHAILDMKMKYEALLRDRQGELQEQKNHVQSIEHDNNQLRWIIYLLLCVVVCVALPSYFFYRKIRATNRLLHEANMKLEIQSTRDPLTGLLNRHAFHDSMKARMKAIDRRLSDANQPPHALALLDIDHFKLINDKFGHAVGDSVLIEVGNRLTQIMRENDKLMRWSGQEFLFFLNNITIENLERVIQRVLSVVGGMAFNVKNKTLNVTISIGYISLAQGKNSDIDENWEKSLKLADAALYKAKINGRNQAVGILNNTIDFQDIDAMLTINLDELTDQDKIVVSKIMGPLQQEKVNSNFATDC